MRLEIAERLRCPRAHEPSPLVLVAQEVVERELRRGVAGCPVCGAEARIVNGDVLFDADAALDTPFASPATEPQSAPEDRRAEREALDRLIALLGLGEPEGTVLLTGRYVRFAAQISNETSVSIVISRPLAHAERDVSNAEVSAFTLAEPLVPFSDHTFRGAAVDSTAAALLADAARTLVVGGRLLAPAEATLPPSVRELARDKAEWVAEREAGSGAVIPLRRA